jgi:hypothetical protein
MRRLRAVSARRRWAIWLLSLLPVWISIACGTLTNGLPTPAITPGQLTSAATAMLTPGGPATKASPGPPPTSAATAVLTPGGSATAPPISTQPGEYIVEQNIVFGPGTLIYTDTQAGLAELSSYQAELTVTFAGTRDGQAEQWSKTYVMLATNDPPARQWTIEATGLPSNPSALFLAELAGTDYERRGEEACTATVIAEGRSLAARLEPASLLTAVVGAEEVGAETINEVTAVHYTFDQRALGQDGLTQSIGELWVAAGGSPVIKYTLASQGSSDYFGEGVEGTLTLDYELTGINQPVSMKLPEDCPPGLVGAPMLADAANVVNVPGTLAYDTATSLAEASAFYQQQLPGLGWEPDGQPDVAATATVLNYKQGDQQLTVILATNGDLTTVNVVLGRLPE